MNKTICAQLEETLYHQTHQSGLEVYLLPKRGYSKSYAAFTTRYGSADAAFLNPRTGQRLDVPDGIAHFLEHKMFEQPDGTDAFAEFAKTGADANAFTTFLVTSYLFSCTEGFDRNLRHLLSFVQTPHFTEQNVAKEQGIIGQEIKMYEDDPGWRSYFNTVEAMYHCNPVRRDTAGTVESIAQITPELLYDCYNTFYHPSNMILFCAGDLTPEQVMSAVDEAIDPAKKPLGTITRFTPEEPETVFEAERRQTFPVAQPMFYLGIKTVPQEHLLRQELVLSVLMEAALGKSAPLYQALYRDGLITPSFDMEITCEREYAHIIAGGDTPDPDRAFAEMKKGLWKLKETGLPEEDFERAKKIVLGDLIRTFNGVDKISQAFMYTLFRGHSLFEIPSLLSQITKQDCDREMQTLFCDQKTALSVVTA